jgi:hypothetical protein
MSAVTRFDVLADTGIASPPHRGSAGNETRTYVAVVRSLQLSLKDGLDAAELEEWIEWALTQASKIDPVLNGSFKHVSVDE